MHILQTIQENQNMVLFGFVIAALTLGYIAGIEFAAGALMPFFAGTGGADAGDGGCASCGEGGGSGDSGGGSGGGSGSDSNCGCNTTGCNTSSSSTSSGTGGGGGSNPGSTPYFYLQNKMGDLEMQNDVMVTNPSALYMDYATGQKALLENTLTADTYVVSAESMDIHAPLTFAIKEIEIEESYIKDVAIETYNVPTDHMVIQGADHTKNYVVPAAGARPVAGSIRLNNEIVVNDRLRNDRGYFQAGETLRSMRLNQDDALTFSVHREDGKPTHLIVDAFWRDYITGQSPEYIHGIADTGKKVLSPYSLKAIGARVGVVMAAVSSFFVGPAITPNSNQNDMLSFMQRCNGVHVAHADVPHTFGGGGGDSAAGESAAAINLAPLSVSYLNTETKTSKSITKLQSRVYEPRPVLLEIPDEAYNENGEAVITVYSHKRQYIKDLRIVHGKVEELQPVEKLETVITTKHDRNTTKIDSVDVTHLVAGDTVTLTTPAPKKPATHIGLKIKGFYTPLSPESAKVAESLETALTPKEKRFVRSMGQTVA